MHGYRLIALDMDGTLLNSSKEITPKVKEALRRARRLGKTLVISTGRCIPEMEDYREELSDVQYMICVSGAMILDCRGKGVIYSEPIGPDIVRTVLELTRGRDIMIHLLGQESVVEKEKVSHMDRYHMGIYRPLYERVTTQAEDIRDYFYGDPYPVAKVNLYHINERERELSRAVLCHLPVDMKDSEETSLELSALGVNKGTGLEVLCRRLGISPVETIAVGDGDNDADILAAAGLSLAMGNANERIKKMCDVVIPDNDHDGCAAAVETYLLGGAGAGCDGTAGSL